MFLPKVEPKDYECGYNIELMIDALPQIKDFNERTNYAKRIVGLIKQSHINWVDDEGRSPEAWDLFFHLAKYDPRELGIQNPFDTNSIDDAR